MARLFGIITVILALVLLPPTTLALISNNAVPGDSTYQIKLGLENGILFFVSFNPTTKAWFARAKSDRRYQEVEVLLSKGKSASPLLEELIIQTEKAATDINLVENSQQKQQLISQLSDSINKYNQGLEKATRAESATVSMQTPTPTPTPLSAINPQPSATPANSAETISPLLPVPTVTPAPALTPTPLPTTTPAPIIREPSPSEAEEIRKTRERLEQIRQRLEQERNQMKSKDVKKEEDKINKDKSEENNGRKELEKGKRNSRNID